MLMSRRSILGWLVLPVVVGLLWVGSAVAEKSPSYQAALESIRAADLGRCVAHLADPQLEGREAGTQGGWAAGDYLAQRYDQCHLKGAGTQGYFQPFPPNYRNILAIVVGSDPKLRDQVIVVGAHYDHIGYGGNGLSLDGYGSIHPGADDNASGSAAVAGLAKAWTVLRGTPKRSVLFANWDGEEKGLLGSKYWVANPTVPLAHVAAALNLDMVGRLRHNHLVVYGWRSGDGWRRLLSQQNGGAGLELDFDWTLEARADHYSFFSAGIPVLMFFTGMHADYHRSSDVADRINSQGIEQVTRLLFALVYDLADRPAVPAFRAAAADETPETEQTIVRRAVRLPDSPLRWGITWRGDDAEPGTVILSYVVPGSPAARSGLAAGDRVYQVAGRDFSDGDEFARRMKSLPDRASLLVERDGRPRIVTLEVEHAAPAKRAA
jgi:hypothetical protein